MKKFALGLLAAACASALWASDTVRDEFFWLGEMNKATTVINTDEKLLDKAVVKKVAHGLQTVIANGNKQGGPRPKEVIKFEPFLIKEAGMDVTMLHIGRSSQDMHATYRSAIMRDNVLALSEKLAEVMSVINDIARKNQATIVPNYTNGVAAQPNSYAHYLMGYQASFERTQQQLRDFYERLNWCSMGTTVLNGTSWPLNRERMAKYLGFNGPVPNAYDASQMKSVDEPIELAGIITGMAVRVGSFIEDVFVQYAQPRPWILLVEGGENTYVSSAMPQKRNPGIMVNTRKAASKAIAQAQSTVWLAHNIQPGMSDNKSVADNNKMAQAAIEMLDKFERVLKALKINPERALEELNNDWTASQEVADVLMREYKLPFRVGHHVASGMVSYARANNIQPLDFPYAQMQRIYAEVIAKEYPQGPAQCPMSEELFKKTLDPRAIVANRKTAGGPQPKELAKAVKAMDKSIAGQREWVQDKREHIDKSLKKLDRDFQKLL